MTSERKKKFEKYFYNNIEKDWKIFLWEYPKKLKKFEKYLMITLKENWKIFL